MCEHVPRAQTPMFIRVDKHGNIRYPEIDGDHEMFTYRLSCDPAVRNRQLRILKAAVLQIQDYVPALYENQRTPDRVSELEADKYDRT